jgi:hypothetical protein
VKSSSAGGNTTATAEVVGISRQGFWLQVDGEGFFLSFQSYPWFETAPARSIFAVELLHGFHLRWPDLDVDLEMGCLHHPKKYPLRFDSLTG